MYHDLVVVFHDCHIMDTIQNISRLLTAGYAAEFHTRAGIICIDFKSLVVALPSSHSCNLGSLDLDLVWGDFVDIKHKRALMSIHVIGFLMNFERLAQSTLAEAYLFLLRDFGSKIIENNPG
jgi:hypothetical protein